ncbi:conserved hypothetical protein [Ricinus communis]|uniref:Uncharacterized protein n=1 Tax=Ricinus communis TaxID=3988 RepID=B9SCP8_RICCO|nr:conserved hypothetical protein [Ricinus communis]
MDSQQQQEEENSYNDNNNMKKNYKKTRDLPNLSECHSCGFRVDCCSNGKNNDSSSGRLQTLYSEWRIVLLCKICFFRVESCHICAYCFKDLSSSDNSCLFRCPQCKRIIHRTCFSNYSNFAPWSFSSKFSVCVDCWVPKSIASRRACFRTKKSKSNCKYSSLEDVVRDADFDVQRKVEAAAKARELVVEKALAARKAAQLVHNAFDLVSERDDNGIANVDDVQLALHLHLALNSSPRILSNLCSLDSAGSSPLVRGRVCRKLNHSNGGKPAAGPSVPVRVSGYDSSLHMDSFGSNGIDENLSRRDAKDSDIRLKEGEGSCFDKVMNSKAHSCRQGDGFIVLADERCNGKPDRYSIKYTRRTSADERCNRKPEVYLRKYARRTSADEGCNKKPDPYLRKYSRRISVNEKYDGKLDRYLRKYSRRRTPTDERDNRKPDLYSIKYTRRSFAIGLVLSCSLESLTSSNDSTEVCPSALQFSACSSGLSGDHS